MDVARARPGLAIVTINLSDWAQQCQICGEWDYLTHCVPFYEEPRPDVDIGDTLPCGGVVGGMSCCKTCHDTIYATHQGESDDRDPDPRPTRY